MLWDTGSPGQVGDDRIVANGVASRSLLLFIESELKIRNTRHMHNLMVETFARVAAL